MKTWQKRLTAFCTLISLGVLSSVFGVLVYWLTASMFGGYAVIPMAAVASFFLGLFVSVMIGMCRNREKHAVVAAVISLVAYAIGFAIPLGLTHFGIGEFRIEGWALVELLVVAMLGSVLVWWTWTHQDDPSKSASLFPHHGSQSQPSGSASRQVS